MATMIDKGKSILFPANLFMPFIVTQKLKPCFPWFKQRMEAGTTASQV
jgi:hypothetical protein